MELLTVNLNGISYDVYLSLQPNSQYKSNTTNSIVIQDLIQDYLVDFLNIKKWSESVSDVVEDISIKLNSFSLQEIKTGRFLVSGDFKVEFLNSSPVKANQVKDLIIKQGVNYSKGYRYWFLFELKLQFLQLYMFPYYKYTSN